MVLSRVKSGRNRNAGFDVRRISTELPERAPDDDKFPQELIAPYEENFFALLDNYEEKLIFGNLDDYLSLCLFLQNLFPLRKTDIRTGFERVWARHESELMQYKEQVDPNLDNAFIQTVLMALEFFAPDKLKILASAWNLESGISKQSVSMQLFFNELSEEMKAAYINNDSAGLLAALKKEDECLDYAASLLLLSLLRESLLAQLRDGDKTYFLQMRKKALEIMTDNSIDPMQIDFYEFARKAFSFKIFFCQKVLFTSEGLKFYAEQKEQNFVKTPPQQPAARAF